MIAALLPTVKRFWSVATPKYLFPLATNFSLMLLAPPVLLPTGPVPVLAGAVEVPEATVDSVVEVAVVAVVGAAVVLVTAVPGRHCE